MCYPPWPWSWCKCQWPPKVEKRNKWSMKCYLPATFRHRELSCLQPFNLYYWVLRLSWSFVSLASVRIRSFSFKLYFTQCRPGTVAGSLQFVWSSLVVGRSAVKLFIYQSDDTPPPPKKKLNFEKRIKKKSLPYFPPHPRISRSPLPSWPYLPHALKCFCLLACACACTYACCKFLCVHIYILVAVLPRSSERKQSWDNF